MLLMYVVHASTISRNSVGFVGILPPKLQSRWQILWLVAALTAAILYFTTQICQTSIDYNKYKIACQQIHSSYSFFAKTTLAPSSD